MPNNDNKRIAIRSVDDFLHEIFMMEKAFSEEAPFKKVMFLFRGHSKISYELMPSIGRNRKFDVDISIMNQERNLIELAKHRLPEIFTKELEPLELLALLQH